MVFDRPFIEVFYKYRMRNGYDAGDVFKSGDDIQVSIPIPENAIRDEGQVVQSKP